MGLYTTMRRYFAYGSNMWDAQMRKRCPQSKKLGFARLPGYRWIISARGYANVVEFEKEEVEGVLFELTDSDEASLDRSEGVSLGHYGKFNLRVIHHGQDEDAFVYIDPVVAEGSPCNEYIDRINSALVDAKLSESYVATHIRRFITG